MLQKVFGPVLGLVGEDLQRVYAAGRDAILANAYKKVEDPGDGKQANLRVTRDVLWNGSFADSEICAEYFGGIMASGLLGVLGMSDQEWERAGERGELPSGEPEVASPSSSGRRRRREPGPTARRRARGVGMSVEGATRENARSRFVRGRLVGAAAIAFAVSVAIENAV